jgi:hypothetical protein
MLVWRSAGDEMNTKGLPLAASVAALLGGGDDDSNGGGSSGGGGWGCLSAPGSRGG